MIKILIVDDNDYGKTQSIIKILNTFESIDISQDIIEVKDLNSAKRIMMKESIDLLLLDIKIPVINGEDAVDDGGIQLLEQIHIDDKLKKPKSIIGISSLEGVYDNAIEIFEKYQWTILKFDRKNDGWENKLKNKIKYLLDKNCNEIEKFDIAIVTALYDRELEAVLNLPCKWEQMQLKDDPTVYYKGIIEDDDNSLKIIAASSLRMGMSASSALTTKMCINFKPEFIFMVGILAGIEGKCHFGDILVADPSWDWGNGKLTIKENKPIFQCSPHQLSLESKYRAILKHISVKREFVDEIKNKWPSQKPESSLNIHIGAVASGASVLEDPAVAQSIKEQHRELIGIEMEIYGMMSAIEYLPTSQQPIAMAFKSVCDYADPHKNDNWQTYAAYTSSNFLYQFIINYIFNK